MSPMRAGEIVDRLLDRYPAAWADEWDRVGLLVGDPLREVDRVLCALGLEEAVLERAVELDTGLVVTHHPPFLEDLHDLTWSPEAPGCAMEALTMGLVVATMHTNLDRAPQGASALPAALGLPEGTPIEEDLAKTDVVVCYCPEDRTEAILEAMAAAGAGRVGNYDGCAFVGPGEGRFRPLAGSRPTIGGGASGEILREKRIEMTCPPGRTHSVVGAARAAHPYEEPVISVSSQRLSRGGARLGRLCELEESVSLDTLASRVAARLGVSPRVWGAPQRAVATVACVSGSASGLVARVLALGADALVCGEVRYHAAHEATERGLAIIEVGHDVSELPIVGVLAEALHATVEREDVEVTVFDEPSRWWTWSVK